MTKPETTWRKSTFSQADCVEAAGDGDSALVRDSKDPTGPVLELGREAFAVLVASVKAGG